MSQLIRIWGNTKFGFENTTNDSSQTISVGFVSDPNIGGEWWVDSFDSYALASLVDDGLWNSGNETTSSFYFDGAWSGGQGVIPNTHGRDFFDTYNIGDDLNGLSGGYYWTSVWYSYDSYAPSWFGLDYFDTYTLGESIQGLNGGSSWSGSWSTS